MLKIGTFFIFLALIGCSSNPTTMEKAWIKDYIDTGEFRFISVKEGKLSFQGSTKEHYNNIDKDLVLALDIELLNQLKIKYGANNIYPKGGSRRQRRFDISYTILNNTVRKKQYNQDSETCYSANRAMEIQLQVIDNNTNNIVWGGKLGKQIYDSNCKARTKPKSENVAGAMIEALVGSAVDTVFSETYPDTPSVQYVAKDIFNGFYGNML